MQVTEDTYPCSGNTCWGILSASGLPPGTHVTGFAPQVPGNTGQGVDIDVEADTYGKISASLELLCNNDYHVTNPNIPIDATSGDQGFSVDAPDSCG